MTDHRVETDVGDANTDTVVVDGGDNPPAKVKAPTTEGIASGILSALNVVLDNSGVSKDELDHVMFDMTHATNAITRRHSLNRVGVIRVGAPAIQNVHPLLK